MKDIVIIGAGGFGRETAWIIERINAVHPSFRILGFCDDIPDKQSGQCGAYPLLGAVERVKAGTAFTCAIGNNRKRKEVTERAESAGLVPATVIDPSASLAPNAEIGAGSYIGIGSILSVGACIGRGTLINHHVCIGHDVRTGDWCQFCPGVCVSGGCVIGNGVLFGTLSGMLPLKQAGAWSLVGASTVPLKDIPENATIVRLR